MDHNSIQETLKSLALETTNADLSKVCQQLAASISNNSIEFQAAIQILSGYILEFENAKLFRKYLSNILLALVSTKIPLKPVFSNTKIDSCNDSEKINHLEYSIALALLSDHPDILQYTLKYFEINPIPPYEVFIHHEDSYNVAPKKRRLQECRQKITDMHIVSCCYTLLKKLPNELSLKWDWTKFVSNFSSHVNAEVRWMVKECMVILTNMTETQSKILAKNINTSNHSDDFQISAINKEEVITTYESIGTLNLNGGNVVNIDGIMLPLYDKNNVRSGNLVPVKSTVNNLRSLALAVASGKALCLMGPVGSGKTSLVENLAAITGRKGIAFKKVQLGDQTDSRILLGSQQCTDIPGEFVWKPGVLTEAVQKGHWLLLEDIDCAALDVASTLSSLLERNALCVPGYRDSLPVTPGFQLFVTQRTVVTNYGFQKKISNSSTLLQKHVTQINVEPLSTCELGEIIQTLYPSLKTICSRMLKVFMMFSVGSHDTSMQTSDTIYSDNYEKTNVTVMRGSRLISTRDLMKWCSRAVVDYDVSSQQSALNILQNALDIFTCSVPLPEHRLELAKKVGTCLGIVETKSEFYCKYHKPNVSLKPSSLEVGRAKVPRKDLSLESTKLNQKRTVFSFTRQSACLLERIACCVTMNEPVLLVGETGTGKTSSIQYLARQTGHKLVVINMNQQSDSADLLGGYKPVDLKYIILPIRAEYEELFRNFYNVEKNEKFLNHIETCYVSENWADLLALMKHTYKAGINKLTNKKDEYRLQKWVAFGHKLLKLEQQVKAASRLTFAFIEGSLVKAMQEGYWVLLDEINLASPEILECLAGLLENKNESIELLEKSDKVLIKRHPDFTLFACMNPATDVGKKDLPIGLRNRFTEFFIDELTERNDLILLIGDYLYHLNLSGVMLEAIYKFYASVKKEAKLSLVDGAGNAPHYSLRTLCRALTAAAKAKCGTVTRSLYEAFCLSFLTQLDSSSHPKVEAMIVKAVIGKKNIKSIIKQPIPEPQVPGQKYLLFEGHWIPQGKLEIIIPEGYILTPTVRKNLRDIARIISLSRLPVLLQGDTSVGKTSLITYIAKASGNYCVRINNHEHTDLQEYIGSYSTDTNGKLVFKEGVLVEAMRKGYWVILDELNLAPSDVLEALNRVLDDNRELFIPETQQMVKADPNFMLFATQNPPGLYGGRKMLSRAFRNRFVELHFDEIPRKELETILHERCHVPPTYCKKMIAVMAELQVRRRGSATVLGKDGFVTLRDLFRWGQRYKYACIEILTKEKFYDWDQHIADEGYLVLAGKVRQPEERNIIEGVIEKHMKRKVCPENLFSLHEATSPVTRLLLNTILNNHLKEFSHIVWTFNMRRLAVLIAKAFTFNEPVLLVGETGCGKTTICQVLAALRKTQLLSINCHMHTESSDFLGGLRPVRQSRNDGRLFEWVDGPLIKAMQCGYMFLADEISLADDSVLERLNSLLEPERQLLLSEKSAEDNSEIVMITAEKDFHFIGTMNPGGDFGKKELSPALRNRFTEIWCDSVTSREDLLNVLEKSVHMGISLGNQEDGSSGIGNSILDFCNWLKSSEVTNKFPFSIRDLLSWVQFINVTVAKGLLDVPEAYVHGACMTFLDCFGTALTGHIDTETLCLLRKNAINFLLNQIKTTGNEYTESLREMLTDKQTKFIAESDATKFGIKPFYIEIGENVKVSEEGQTFTFTAPTTGSNTLRLLRGLQLNKAILLEGNPGVGKTSLVTALAKSSGHKVVRINLSDQTDITDLFGTDLPTENGTFTFKEGAFLNALQNGDWILLDELNLAPQPVLEGLNACLDHRGEMFIPELGKTFKVKEQTRLFACQNPLKQGGARRGLPISFLNRFTQVYIDTLTHDDLIYIVELQYPRLSKDILHRMVKFNSKVSYEITDVQSWGHRGSPWEMNLRDIQRWCEALIEDQNEGKKLLPGKFVEILYINRMRTFEDKTKMAQAYDEIFLPDYPRSDNRPQFDINDKEIIIGDVSLERNAEKGCKNRHALETNLLVLRNQLPTLKALTLSVKMNWLSIIVGPTATGKSSIVQVLADLTGNNLQVVPVTSAMDVSDLLGGFEQVDYTRNLENLFDKIETLTLQTIQNMWLTQQSLQWKSNKLLSHLYQYKSLQSNLINSEYSNNQFEKFNKRIQFLLKHCENLVECSKTYDAIWNKLQEVMSSLKTLETKVTKSSSINAGGKFEWIDSLLVKSMLEGSWILLDNVNLTSAAVLDRLNGLLEPNGVLSIPERGEFSELRPHPKFRVFFTVDPKYGEISRAMRNRGVETFLLRPNDWNTSLTETVTHMDLVALLSSCGLPTQYHQICIKCHELMTSFIHGLDRPTLSQLLQATHLTTQQIVRGISHKTALINSFSDVYIKPRCGGDFASNLNASLSEMKIVMLKTLEKVISDKDYGNKSFNANHTLTIKGLSKNSSFEISKQNAYVALQQSIDTEYNLDLVLYVLFSISTCYQRSSDYNLHIFYKILKHAFDIQGNDGLKELCHQLNEIVYERSINFGNSETHKRFYPEMYSCDDRVATLSNKKSLLVYNDLFNKLLKMTLPNNNFSALDYSKAVNSGNVTDDFVEYPILKYCHSYLQTIDEYIESAIKSVQTLDDKTMCQLLQLLNWRSRFINMCSVPILFTAKNKKTPILKEEIIPLLYMHSKWLQKHLLGELIKLLPSDHELVNKFKSIINNSTLKNDQDNSEMAKLGKKLKKRYGQPNLYENKNEYDLCVARTNIYNKSTLDMNQPIERQLQKLSNNISSIFPKNLAFDVPETDILTTVQENIAKVFQNGKDISKLEVKLLPVIYYIIQRVLNILQKYLLKITSELSSDENHIAIMQTFQNDLAEILTSLVHLCAATKGYPPALLNLLQVIDKLQDNTHELHYRRISSLIAKFWDEYYKVLVNSPAIYPLPFLNIKSSNSEGSVEDIPTNTKRLSTNLPLLTYYVQNLIVSTNNEDLRPSLSYETVALKDRDDYSGQLSTLLNILWKNIATLDSAATLKLNSDTTFEMQKYELLICYLHSIILTKKSNFYSNDLTEETIQILRKYYNKTFVDKLEEAYNVYKCLQGIVIGKANTDKIKTKILTARLSLLTSFLLVDVMAQISPVDQIEKYRFKVKYIEEDVKMFEALLSTYYIHGLVSGSITDSKYIEKASDVTMEHVKENKDCLNKVHPHCSLLFELKEKTTESVHKYASGNTFRPNDVPYSSFVKDCKHFTKSVLSSNTTKNIYPNLQTVGELLYENLQNNKTNKTIAQKAHNVLKETASWLYSVNAFYKKIETSYSDAFPDLAKPLQSSLSQIVYSVTSFCDLIRELVVKVEQGLSLNQTATDLIIYPNHIPRKNEKQSYLNRFVSDNFTQILRRNILSSNNESFSAELEYIAILKMNLFELKMLCTAIERVDKTTFKTVLTTLTAVVKAWDKQQQEIEKKKQDDEALYVTKSKCEDVDDEVLSQEEISEMFPSYTDEDFSEFKGPSLEQTVLKKQCNTEHKNQRNQLITADDVSLIYKWHSSFLRIMTAAEWLPRPKKLVGNDVVTSFIQRYPIFCSIMQKAWEALDADFEGILSPSLMVLISEIKSKIDGCDVSSSKADFYRSPWVSETKQCVPLLQKVRESTNQLLDQWPDFPTLKDIVVIVDRILSFPITSPVSRFLTGLELLRDKIEEWNKNAHKGNNMIDISLAIGQQIINWRKLEMGHWKECLNNLYHKKQSEAHKYWFYLYNAISSYLEDSSQATECTPVTPERVIDVLKSFMETSNLAEYEVRLDIIYVYHCHLVHLEASPRRDELLSILWNTYNYYSQFSAHVATQIKEKRAPIEKKLRDFVKICTWDRDLSYWSVKDTVEKAHKALYKHTKEFETVLKESVLSYLVDNTTEAGVEHVGIWDRPKRATGSSVPAGGAYLIDTQNHIVLARNIKKYLDQAEQPCKFIADGSLLSKVVTLLNKAKTLCKDTISNTSYPSLVQALDDFVMLIIETSTHLGSFEVDETLPKEKQKSQAKSIVQQKRKALADLFKYLAKMGLNYRTGLVILSATNGELYDFTIPPVDLDATMSYMKSRRCDPSLALLWSGCEKYFQKNISRHRLLSAALQSPHKDLGIQNNERIKGFAAQLLKITNSQKKSISEYSRYLYNLRVLVTNLTNALDVDTKDTNISNLKEEFDILTECYSNIGLTLDQFNILLKSCPEKTLSVNFEPDFDAVLSSSPIVHCYKNTEEWRELYSKIKSIINAVNKQKTVLHKASNAIPIEIGQCLKEVPFVSQSYISAINEGKSNLDNIKKDIDDILERYQFKLKAVVDKDHVPQHPVLRSIGNLSQYLKEIIDQLAKLDEPHDVFMEENETQTDLIDQTEDLIATMLLIIQSVYKKHLPQNRINSNVDVLNAIDEIISEENKKEEAKDILEDKHLKEHLEEKLSEDAKLLQLDTLINKIQCLLINYIQYISTKSDVDEMRNALMRLVPILEQTMLFVQYFITQKVAAHRVSCKMLSVLLKIFSDLASKGFCKPSDLDMEDGDGEGGPGKLSSGTGLGDGEGQTDVSERIENQDQLEDAQRSGEEKKEENRDCKEEEKGIDMTDDFDSHLQDVEKKEGENSDEDDDKDDPDKQMGELDNAAEKLDQQIWGSEDEEEPEEGQSDKKEKEERGTGESTGEKEMAAKEEEKGQDDDSKGKDKKQKKDINEMDEPELDDDQVDPHHSKEQQLPEPEDFELPDNVEVDGDESENDKDGETETENPFDVNVMKENISDENENDDKEDSKEEKNKDGLEVSSDEDEGDNGNVDGEQEEKDDNTEDKNQDKENDIEQNVDDDNPQENADNPENNSEPPEENTETTEQNEEEKLPKNTEKLNEDDEIEQNNQEPNPQANPSNNDPSAEERAENAEMDKGTDDNVETNAAQEKDEDAAPYEQVQEQIGEEQQSTGRSELDKSDRGHRGEKQAANQSDSTQEKRQRHENKPGQTDIERTLAAVTEEKHKRSHTLNAEREESAEDSGKPEEDADKEADEYQHVKQAKQDDLQVIDAATKEQADQQPTLREDKEAEKLKDDEEVPMEVDDEDTQVEKSEELKSEKMKDGSQKEKNQAGNKDGEEKSGNTVVEVEGGIVLTAHVPRGPETTYHTKLDDVQQHVEDLTVEQYMGIREWLNCGPTRAAPEPVWRALWRDSALAARALCERLRLVLEPTGRSRMAGDFRTGRVINMRRVIPYIASHFRKDRIWLRRTKPAKREYKIAIAMDDSNSMAINNSKEMAFESLALVSQALNLLESGDLAVVSFGEKPTLLHPFTEQFTEHSGSKILQKLRFEQKMTNVAQLLDFCTVLFDEQCTRSDAINAKLLVIVGDGRFSEGEVRVVQAVRRAQQKGIFLVFVIIDNPDNKDSIMDVIKPIFDPETKALTGFVQYLDQFPFPYYLILRDITALPTVLGDALRQWFELAANTAT